MMLSGIALLPDLMIEIARTGNVTGTLEILKATGGSLADAGVRPTY